MLRSDYKERQVPAFGGGQEEHSWKKEHLVQIPRWEKAWQVGERERKLKNLCSVWGAGLRA